MDAELYDPNTSSLHECRWCGLQYESTEELINHVKKFCSESAYWTPNDRPGRLFDETPRRKSENMNVKGTLGNTPINPFKKAANAMTQARVNELISELNKLKSEKRLFRLDIAKDEEEIVRLMRSIEEKKKKEVHDRITKEENRFFLSGFSKRQLDTLKELSEKIDINRAKLEQRELEILAELKSMEHERKELEKIQQEVVKKRNQEAEKVQYRELRQQKVGDILLDEVAEKLASLKYSRELLEKERMKIKKDLDKIHFGENDWLSRNNSSILSAKQVLNSNDTQRDPKHSPISSPTKSSITLNLPKELKAVVDEKDQENARIQAELQLLKSSISSPREVQSLQLSSPQPNKRLNFDKFLGNKEFFVMNEVKSVDLSEEERMLVNIAAQEVDILRMLSQIPIGTELYRYKLDQFKELSTTRAEVEKIVQEQQIQKLRRGFEKPRRDEDRKHENQRFVDDWRKQIISTRLRKDLNQDRADRKYDPTEGLVIHWDYCLGLPKRTDHLQLVYGIYINGEEVFAPRLIEPHSCEVDTSQTNRCIIGESHLAPDIPANSSALLIFELQSTTGKGASGRERVISYAWGQLDLFDTRRELKRGKFKVPLYAVPTIPSIDIDEIKHLEPVDNGLVWFYLRISYPSNDEFGKQQSLYPENSHFEYVIPQIHLRSFRPQPEPMKQDDGENKPLSRRSSDKPFVIREPAKNFVKEKPSNPILEMSQSYHNSTLDSPQKLNAKLTSIPTNKASPEPERSIRQFDSTRSRSDKEY